MKFKKIAAVLLAAVMASSFAAGCGSSVNIDAAAATLDDKEISMGVANFMAQCQAAQMDSYLLAYYGEDMWNSDSGDGTTMTDSVKKGVMDNLWEFYVLDAHAADYGVEVTEEDKSAITAAAAKFKSANSEEAVRVMNASQENVEEMLRLYKIQDKMRDAIEAEIDTNVTDAECAQKTFSYVKFEKPQEGGESGETEASQDADAEGAEPEKTAEEVKADAQALLDGGADNLETAAEAGSYTVLKCSYGPDDLEEEKNTTSLDVEILKTADKLKDGVMADALAETDDSYYVIRMDSVDDKEAAEKKKESILSQRRSEKYDEVLQKYKDDSKWTVHEKEWKKVNFENLYTIKTAEQETAADDGTAGSTTADDGAAGTEGSTAADDGTAGTEGSTAADDGTAGTEEGQEPQTAADDGAAGTEEGQEPQTAAE